MAFTSFSFLLFAGLVIAAYYLVPQKLQWWVLLIASYAFYLTADVKYLFFIILTTVTTYFAARQMGKALEVQMPTLPSIKKSCPGRRRRSTRPRSSPPTASG